MLPACAFDPSFPSSSLGTPGFEAPASRLWSLVGFVQPTRSLAESVPKLKLGNETKKRGGVHPQDRILTAVFSTDYFRTDFVNVDLKHCSVREISSTPCHSSLAASNQPPLYWNQENWVTQEVT